MNDEFQRLILEKLIGLEAKLTGLEAGQSKLDAKIDSVKTELKQDIAKLDTKIDELGSHQEENVIGILRLMDSKIDKMATQIDATERVETKIDILSHRILAQDGEIQLLKRAK